MVTKKLCLFFYLVIFSSLQAEEKGCRYFLSICAIFRDEAPYLEEWIEYHRLVGAEHFYLYNNNSQDHYLEVLAPYIAQGVVELIDWPSRYVTEDWLSDQIKAHNHCLEKCREETAWVGFIDMDEFILPLDRADLVFFLSEYADQPEVGGIRINWQLFGTSGLEEIPPDKLLIESLTLKAPWNYETIEDEDDVDNTAIKSIVRPKCVKRFQIHGGTYHEGFYAIPKGAIGPTQPIQVERICINHYWTRTENFFYNVKIARRLRFMPKHYVSIMQKKLQILNQVEDTRIHRFVPELKKRLNKG
jgi:hypothetical protein